MSDPGGWGTCSDSSSTSQAVSNAAELRNAWKCANDNANGNVFTIDLLADISLTKPSSDDGTTLSGSTTGQTHPTALYLVPGKKLLVRKAASVLAYRARLWRPQSNTTPNFRIIFVDQAELTLEYVSIEGGKVEFNSHTQWGSWNFNTDMGGGGIYVRSGSLRKLILTGCLMKDNQASGFGSSDNQYAYGEAIFLSRGSLGYSSSPKGRVELHNTLIVARSGGTYSRGSIGRNVYSTEVIVDESSTVSDFCWSSSGERWEGGYTSYADFYMGSYYSYFYYRPTCATGKTTGNIGSCGTPSTTTFTDVRTEIALREATACGGGASLVTIELSRDISLISSYNGYSTTQAQSGLYIGSGEKVKIRKADALAAQYAVIRRDEAMGTQVKPFFRVIAVDGGELTLEKIAVVGGYIHRSSSSYIGPTTARFYGGGLFVLGESVVRLQGCVVDSNSALKAGGIYLEHGANSNPSFLTYLELQDTIMTNNVSRTKDQR